METWEWLSSSEVSKAKTEDKFESFIQTLATSVSYSLLNVREMK